MGSPPLFFLNVYPIKHPESERTLIIPPTHSTVLYLIRIFLIIQFRVRAIFTAQVFTHSSSRSRNWIASQNISSERQNVNCKLKRGGKWRLQLVYSAYGLNAPNTKCIQIFGFQRYVLQTLRSGRRDDSFSFFSFHVSASFRYEPLTLLAHSRCVYKKKEASDNRHFVQHTQFFVIIIAVIISTGLGLFLIIILFSSFFVRTIIKHFKIPIKSLCFQVRCLFFLTPFSINRNLNSRGLLCNPIKNSCPIPCF